MGKPVLLLVWIIVPRFYYPRHIVLANRNCYGLLSIMRRGNCKLQNILELIADFHSFFLFCHGQDYNWWWRSFVVSGGSAIYVFAYAVFYFFTQLEITEFTPTLLYFGYTGLMCVTFWLLTGTIGFYAAYFFVRKIYASVKID